MGIHVPSDAQLTAHKGIAAVIADGVSSADGGREAAETCVQNFLGDYFSTPDSWTVQTSAQKVLTALNRWLYGRGAGLPDAQKGYLCTLSIAVVKSSTAFLFHVGDTRIYLLRGGQLDQLTKDHAVAVSRNTTYLSRAMGLDSRLDVDFRAVPVEVGDVLVLTSDGVHDHVPHQVMVDVLANASDLDGACGRLLDEAERLGSPDNLTCQLVRIEGLPDANAEEYVDHLTRLPFPPELAVGKVLDGFRVVRELHASKRSQLYVVEDESGRRLAMKTPSVNYEDDPAYIERFVLEHWIGTRASSRHLARSIDPPAHRSCLYNLQEYVEGETLAEWIDRRSRGGSLPDVAEVVGIIGQVVKGLMALHRREILHQDLKPSNVVLGEDGVAKIIDFGSCFVAGIDEIEAPIVRDKILGTVSYAAPEYSIGLKAGPAADLYSLGCLTYEMLTGHHPYGSAAETARDPRQFERLTYVPAYSHNPNVPLWIDGALRRAVQVDVGDRYAELSEFIVDLERPNPEYLQQSRPLMERVERDSVTFWKTATFILILTQLATLLALLR